LNRTPVIRLFLSACLLALAPGTVLGATGSARVQACPDLEILRRPHFGDLHVHTAWSLDASTQQTRTKPAQAYRFARGEPLGIQPWDAEGRARRTVKLARPLDFAAVTDHAELLGEVNICNHPEQIGYDSLICTIYRRLPRVAFFYMNYRANTATRHDFCGEDGGICREAARGPWQETQRAAAEANAPCDFTSFVAYEWTGAAGTGNNLHRNVIFAGEAVPALPASFIETPSPPQLWASLRRECTGADTGCDVLVIPHNPNLGAGRMFRTRREDGSPIDVSEARGRAQFERLVEVMQHKGDSECHPGLQSEDELCSFEKLAMDSFAGRFSSFTAEPPRARQFIRNILKEGLMEEERLGVNPFQFGLIGSTDTHLGTPGLVAESADYPGHGGAGTPVGEELPPGLPDELDFNPGGLAVVWAEENTRPSLFAAMQRREVYGTSGPRLVLRFFGGWDYPEDTCSADLAAAGYAGGVPMGGDLPEPPGGDGAPEFLISALRDPGAEGSPGTPLQRLQVVKGWIEGTAPREAVYDVAGGANGASVDPLTCRPSGPGADSLCAVWRDPDFDPKQRAFYYARAIENPVCRWSQQLCVAHGVRCDEPVTIGEGLEGCCSEEHARTLQERAWSSPIWYRP
jgi:hypothetical protein